MLAETLLEGEEPKDWELIFSHADKLLTITNF
jgi:hypothetical protein